MESQQPNYELKIWVDGSGSPATGAASVDQFFAFRYKYRRQSSAEAVPSAASWQRGECIIPRHRYLGDPRPLACNMLSFMGVSATLFDELAMYITYHVLEMAEIPSLSSYRVLTFCLEVSEWPAGTPFDDDREEMERVLRESAAQDQARAVPAAASAVEALKEMKMDASTGSTEWCTICLEGFSEVATEMPCAHVFHKECIVRWLKSSHLCPLCRYAMPTSS